MSRSNHRRVRRMIKSMVSNKQDFRGEERQTVFELILEAGHKNFILDIGCGIGRLLRTLLSYDRDAYGVDLQSAFLMNPLTTDIRGRLIVADTHFLPIRDNSISIVVMEEIIEHLHNPTKALSEAHRILSNKGVLILSTPNKLVYDSVLSRRGSAKILRAISILEKLLVYAFLSLLGRRIRSPVNSHISEFTSVQLKNMLKRYFRNVKIIGINPYLPKLLNFSIFGIGLVSIAKNKR